MADQDSKVRYLACESLYNIAKVTRGNILRFFNEIFDELSKVFYFRSFYAFDVDFDAETESDADVDSESDADVDHDHE